MIKVAYNPESNPGPQQRGWFDDDPTVTYPECQAGSTGWSDADEQVRRLGLAVTLAKGHTSASAKLIDTLGRGTPSTGEDNQITWHYKKPLYDFDRKYWYWEGRRRDGR